MLTIGQKVKIQPDTDFNIWYVGVVTFIGVEVEVTYKTIEGKKRYFNFYYQGFEEDRQVMCV